MANFGKLIKHTQFRFGSSVTMWLTETTKEGAELYTYLVRHKAPNSQEENLEQIEKYLAKTKFEKRAAPRLFDMLVDNVQNYEQEVFGIVKHRSVPREPFYNYPLVKLGV